jgi:type IV pilus assembly protein PilA
MNLPSSILDCPPRGEPKQLGDDTAVRVQDESTSYVRSDAGFTLIELMVVLLIIAILLAIAIPTFLGVTNTAGDRAAQSNLTNALTEVKALYEVNQAYSTNNAAYTSGQFSAQAPEFNWTTASCSTSTLGNCMSFAVGDSATAGDGQALALAAWSNKTSTCWYALDLESAPISIASDTNAVVGQATSKNTAGTGGTLPTAGVFYGKRVGAGGSCQASKAFDPTVSSGWEGNYGSAGTVN